MGNYINREITNGILADFFQGKVIIIVGPRQVGKTTLVESVLAGKEQVVKFVGDNPTDREKLENKDFEQFLDKSYKAIKKNKNLFNDK